MLDLRDSPRWLLMWLLAAAIYFALKLLTWSTAEKAHVPLWRQAAYLFAWPGMNADRFFTADDANRIEPPMIRQWLAGAINFTAGGIIFWTAQYWLPPSSLILLGWAGMIGTILMLHFGSFHLLSCFWRSVGIDARPIMNGPTHSTSIAEFWGRRWNTAFRDITYQFLFRPLRLKFGAAAALFVGFVISGVIHDVVISLPAGGGYGGPTAFFTIQAVAIFFERSRIGRMLGLGQSGRGWLFTAIALLMPVQLLFHDAFVTRIAVPFMEALGAA